MTVTKTTLSSVFFNVYFNDSNITTTLPQSPRFLNSPSEHQPIVDARTITETVPRIGSVALIPPSIKILHLSNVMDILIIELYSHAVHKL